MFIVQIKFLTPRRFEPKRTYLLLKFRNEFTFKAMDQSDHVTKVYINSFV